MMAIQHISLLSVGLSVERISGTEPFPSENQSALADLTRVGELITFCTSSNLNSLVSMRLSDHTGCCLYTQSKPFGSFCGIIKIMVLGERIAWSRNHSVGRFLTTEQVSTCL